MEHWHFIQTHRRDAAIIKRVQDGVVSLIDAVQLPMGKPPATEDPLQGDLNTLSELDLAIASVPVLRVKGGALARPDNTATASGASGQPRPTGGEGESVAGGSGVTGV
jgi:hypothetical protein